MSPRLTGSRHISPVSGIPVRAPVSAADGDGDRRAGCRAGEPRSGVAAGLRRSQRIDGSRPRWFLVSALLHLAVAAQLSHFAGEGRFLPAPMETVTVDLVAPEQVEPAVPPARSQPPDSVGVRVPATRELPQPPSVPAGNATEDEPAKLPSVAATPPVAPARESAVPPGAPGPLPTRSQGEQAVPFAAAAARTREEGSASRETAVTSGGASRVEARQAVEAGAAGLSRSYLHSCRELIERHKEYPLMARKGRVEGTVVVAAEVARDGALIDCRIAKSSGSVLLDNAALRSVRSVTRFPPLPEGLSGGSLDFKVPVSFRLSSR